MKFRNKITAVFSIALLLSLGAVAFIPQAKASLDEVQVTGETEAVELSRKVQSVKPTNLTV